MQHSVFIGLFGLAGILCRYGIDQYFGSWNEKIPMTTLCINIIGSFLAGMIYVFSTYRDMSANLQAGLLVGFCGGFTTFSAYALQTMTMIERGKSLYALTYFVISPIVGLMAAFIPVIVAKKFLV